MACLEVESPTVCRVLQLRLQQRRTREQLVDQGIMPPLKTPAAFHEQIRSLERARTENFLKHKIRSRPERAELIRMHILQETQAEPSLQATQMKLKRARLADDLNEKIAHRPGPMELVEKNILPVDSSVKKAITVSDTNHQKTQDVYNFDEDSSEALAPDDPGSQESQCSVPSPREARLPEFSSATPTSCPTTASNLQACPPTSQSSDLLSQTSAEDQANTQPKTSSQTVTSAPHIKQGHTLVKQSQPRLPSEKSRSKKNKEPKPRVRKLKYHQYIPPDQKQEPSEAPMDSAYARLLQQQQQFLHLQILQQQHFNYQAILPAPLSMPVTESETSCPKVTTGNGQASVVVTLSSAVLGHNNSMKNAKPGPLPANLDEMKVAELKLELKLRGLPVSGTKTDLIERLKPYQNNTHQTLTNDALSPLANLHTESVSMTPPVSPAYSEVSSCTMDDSSNSKAVTMSPSSPKSDKTLFPAVASDKDQRLHEKERQIEELMRKLEQEQRLVEKLKRQLEVEKRQQQETQQQIELGPPAKIKEEHDVSSSCSSTLKQEQQFYVASQRVQPSQTILSAQSGHHILLPTTIHLPQPQTVLQTTASTSDQSVVQSQLLQPLKTETAAFQQHGNQTQAAPQPSSPGQTTLILPPSPFSNHQSPKSKDPPRYEEAIKQTRALQTTMQVPTATSQHMDDLFDVLIETGEISPLIREEPLSQDKRLPVTASVTTLPVSTALSRPPPQVHVAHMPNFVALASDHQLEKLLEGTLAPDTEPHGLRLMEELLLEPHHSPMDTGHLSFSHSPLPSLQDTNLENMEWLELNVPGTTGISPPAGVFSSDFLDTHDLHWN
ncbi:myocardin-related transcription factor B [Trichomycterus rosablanca]|uniref:myocardin-related transcription factor B n=1 Tax=Trichomycterus rosablanca TaxID=2290929 RepID=UPI002F357F6F